MYILAAGLTHTWATTPVGVHPSFPWPWHSVGGVSAIELVSLAEVVCTGGIVAFAGVSIGRGMSQNRLSLGLEHADVGTQLGVSELQERICLQGQVDSTVVAG